MCKQKFFRYCHTEYTLYLCLLHKKRLLHSFFVQQS